MNYNTLKRFFDRAVHKYSVLYPITRTTKSLPRQFFYQELVEIAPPQGSIVECGGAHGDGLVTFAALQPHRKVYGLDSFQGFPTPPAFDYSFRSPLKGQYGECTLSYVQKVLKNSALALAILVCQRLAELKYNFEIGYDSISNFSSPGFTNAELNVLFNQAQIRLLKRRLNPKELS